MAFSLSSFLAEIDLTVIVVQRENHSVFVKVGNQAAEIGCGSLRCHCIRVEIVVVPTACQNGIAVSMQPRVHCTVQLLCDLSQRVHTCRPVGIQ